MCLYRKLVANINYNKRWCVSCCKCHVESEVTSYWTKDFILDKRRPFTFSMI